MHVKCHFYYVDNSQLLIHLFPGNCANSFLQLKPCLNNIHTLIYWQAKYLVCVYTYLLLKQDVSLKIPFYSSSVYKSKVHFNKCFSCDAPKLCNDLPLEIELLLHYHVSKCDLKLICFRSLSMVMTLLCFMISHLCITI